jgi:hypothetical protein
MSTIETPGSTATKRVDYDPSTQIVQIHWVSGNVTAEPNIKPETFAEFQQQVQAGGSAGRLVRSLLLKKK